MLHNDILTTSDPVCGKEFGVRENAYQTKCGDKEYFFCSKMCRDKFNADPGKYVQEEEELLPGREEDDGSAP